VNFETVGLQVEGYVRVVHVVVHEILLDHETLVTQANDEIVETLRFEDFENVPQYRFLAYFNHRFGFQVRFF
jgi:hypothetical protein